MAKRMSNKERIQRRAVEAEAEAKAKSDKKTTKKTTKKAAAKKTAKKTTKKAATKKKTVAAKRQKVVWKVFNAGFKEVASYPYPERKEAEAAAVKMQEKAGAYHFVNAVKVPLEDE